MIRNIGYRKVVIRPVVVICRARGHGERESSTITSNAEAVASSSNTASAGADKRTSPEGPAEKGGCAVKQMQWMPSVAHRTSATALRREKAAEDAQGTRPINVDGVLEARPAGLRRRALLGGAIEAPPEQQQQQVTGMASEQRVFGWPALLNADSGDSSSVASMSATQRFRRKRELERLAAAGSEDAVEALRALGSTLGSSAANSTGGRSEDNGGRRLTPVSSGLSLLFVLVAAGCSYIAVKGGLMPPKWLSSIGDGSGFGGARSEGHHGFGDQEDGESAEVVLTTHGARVEEQQQQLSQGSRMSAGIVDAEAEVAITMGFKANQDGPCRDQAETRQREPLWLKRLRYLEPPKSST